MCTHCWIMQALPWLISALAALGIYVSCRLALKKEEDDSEEV